MEGIKRKVTGADRLAELERTVTTRRLEPDEVREYRRLVRERDDRVGAWLAAMPVPVKRRRKR